MRRIAPIAAALAAALTLALPAGASANTASKIIQRCTHGRPIGGFPQRAYRQALRQMPTEVAEYSECAELISNAELAASGGGHGGHGGSGGNGGQGGGGSGTPSAGSQPDAASAIGNQPIPTTPAEHEAVLKAQSSGSGAVQLGGSGTGRGAAQAPIQPGVVHADLASATSTIPTPLLAILALAAALVLAAAGRMVFLYARRQRQGL